MMSAPWPLQRSSINTFGITYEARNPDSNRPTKTRQATKCSKFFTQPVAREAVPKMNSMPDMDILAPISLVITVNSGPPTMKGT